MEELLEYRQHMLTRLEQAPRVLESASREIQDPFKPLEPGGWNLHQVLVHLRDVNKQVYLPRLQRIMNESDPMFTNFDGEAWMREHYNPQESLPGLLVEFSSQCSQSAAWLGKLTGESWNRPGSHPSFGTHALQWWVERTLAHINEHLIQIKKKEIEP